MLRRKVLLFETLKGGRCVDVRRFVNFVSTKRRLEGGSRRTHVKRRRLDNNFPTLQGGSRLAQQFITNDDGLSKLLRNRITTQNMTDDDVMNYLKKLIKNFSNTIETRPGIKDQIKPTLVFYKDILSNIQEGLLNYRIVTGLFDTPNHKNLGPIVEDIKHHIIKHKLSDVDAISYVKEEKQNFSNLLIQMPAFKDQFKPRIDALDTTLKNMHAFLEPGGATKDQREPDAIDTYVQDVINTCRASPSIRKQWSAAQIYNPFGEENDVRIDDMGYFHAGGAGIEMELMNDRSPNHSIKYDNNSNKFRFTFSWKSLPDALPYVLGGFKEFLSTRPTCIYFKIRVQDYEDAQCGKTFDFYLSDMTFADDFVETCKTMLEHMPENVKADDCLMPNLAYVGAEPDPDRGFMKNMEVKKIEFIISEHNNIKFSFRNDKLGAALIEATYYDNTTPMTLDQLCEYARGKTVAEFYSLGNLREAYDKIQKEGEENFVDVAMRFCQHNNLDVSNLIDIVSTSKLFETPVIWQNRGSTSSEEEDENDESDSNTQ